VPAVETRSSATPRDEVTARLRSFFAAHGENVVAAYLFGSTARGDARPTSDVDVAVLLATPPPATLESIPVELASELTRILGIETEVVILNRAPVDLVKRVLRDGVLVAENDRSRRIAFEVHARNAYWDLLPVLKRYRAAREEGR
jgi:predicted nucleotidyltransferase